jgi:hypothetical protein
MEINSSYYLATIETMDYTAPDPSSTPEPVGSKMGKLSFGLGDGEWLLKVGHGAAPDGMRLLGADKFLSFSFFTIERRILISDTDI